MVARLRPAPLCRLQLAWGSLPALVMPQLLRCQSTAALEQLAVMWLCVRSHVTPKTLLWGNWHQRSCVCAALFLWVCCAGGH